MSKLYPSDLTDSQWELIQPHLPPPCDMGHIREVDYRTVLNAMFYVIKEGCQWRALPHDYGVHWRTVYGLFRLWSTNGTLEHLHAALRGRVRKSVGKEPTPSAGILDSQSAKTTSKAGPRGFDNGKKINGRKRHILVDTLGLLWMVVVHVASVQDFDGGRLVLGKVHELKDNYPRLKVIWADSIYVALVKWVTALGSWVLEVVHRDKETKGFVVLPHRWIVERTFGWFGNYRRLSKDYEGLPAVSEAMCYWLMVHLMARRLTHGQTVWYGT